MGILSHYTYDGMGRRIKQTLDASNINVSETSKLYDQDLLEELMTDDNDLVIKDKKSINYVYGVTLYYVKDVLGSTRALVDDSNKINKVYDYDVFGTPVEKNHVNDQGIRTKIYHYAGYIYDYATSQYFVNARYYQPETGRFTAKDILLVDGFNRYKYVRNNPLKLVDPLGLAGEGQVKSTLSLSFSQKVDMFVTFYNAFSKENNLPKIPTIISAGGTISGIPLTGNVQLVIDKKGNVVLLHTKGIEGNTDIEGSIGLFTEISYNADDYTDLIGNTVNIGIDVDTIIGPGGSYIHGFIETNDGRKVITSSVVYSLNASLVPYGFTGGLTNSKVVGVNIPFTDKRIEAKGNFLDGIDKVINTVEEKKSLIDIIFNVKGIGY